MILDSLSLLLTVSNLIYMNLGLLLGMVFGAIPGLTVLLCIVIFLPLLVDLYGLLKTLQKGRSIAGRFDDLFGGVDDSLCEVRRVCNDPLCLRNPGCQEQPEAKQDDAWFHGSVVLKFVQCLNLRGTASAGRITAGYSRRKEVRPGSRSGCATRRSSSCVRASRPVSRTSRASRSRNAASASARCAFGGRPG